MAEVSTTPWGAISESDDESAEAFCNACLNDLNPAGKPKTKALCKLPVEEPGGMLNASGMRAAAAALAGAWGASMGHAPPEQKRAAARKLMRMMMAADLPSMEPWPFDHGNRWPRFGGFAKRVGDNCERSAIQSPSRSL